MTLSVHTRDELIDLTQVSSTCSREVENAKKISLSFVGDDYCGAILDTSFPSMFKREIFLHETTITLGVLELWSEDFECKGTFSLYRSRLDLAVLESMQLAIEGVVNAVFDGSNGFTKTNADVQFALCRTFEVMLTVSCGYTSTINFLKMDEPALVEVLVHYLDAMGPFMKYFPEGVGSDTSIHSARHARLHICTSFIRIAKAADKSILPHMKKQCGYFCCNKKLNMIKIFDEGSGGKGLGNDVGSGGKANSGSKDALGKDRQHSFGKGRLLSLASVFGGDGMARAGPSMECNEHGGDGSSENTSVGRCGTESLPVLVGESPIITRSKGIADTMACLQREGCLLHSEHNLLGEAFLVMASSSGINMSGPQGLVQLCSEAPVMWSIFHTLTFFERALKRSGLKKANWNSENSSTPNSTPINPMASHISWMVTPLLKVCVPDIKRLAMSCFPYHFVVYIHSLCQALPGEVRAAMVMVDVERSSLLGEGNSKLPKGSLTVTDGSKVNINKEGYAEPNGSNIRNWFKGIRDSGYNVLGLSTTIGDSFFKYLDVHSVSVALMEKIQSMEFRHILQLVHSTLIPLVKNCPLDMWEVWLEKILHPLFIQAQQALSCSWSSLLQDGRAKVPDVLSILSGSDLKVEMMEETIERSHAFLLKHEGLALPTLQLCLEAFTWTEGESVTKISSYCSVLVVLAIVTNHAELIEYVCREPFTSIIQGVTLESNATTSADLVAICREIFVYLCDRHPAPRQVLMSLPNITPHDLVAFEESLKKTSSPKEQKQHMRNMRSLLQLTTGNKLKALAAQKSVNIITNVSSKQ
ncbi:hypothetical protein VNO80_14548 [Phaseolus coccineus]|uniref:Exportin-5 C-terminal domain-containing protein n=1 Tax=Phaseolus coccineus TaxID=3886 RepID=A0AAN9QYI2_PHACN